MPWRKNVVAIRATEPTPIAVPITNYWGSTFIMTYSDYWGRPWRMTNKEVSEVHYFLEERGIKPFMTVRCNRHILLEFKTEAEAVLIKLSHPMATSRGDMSEKAWSELNANIIPRNRHHTRRKRKFK